MLKKVPSSLVFHNYQGDETVSTKEDSVNFVLDSAPVYLLDSSTKEIRSANTKDMVEIIKLVNQLEHVSCITACVVPHDVPIRICDVMMMAVAYNAQIGKYFGLPTAANCGRNDSEMFDAQAATESGFGMLLGALAGINLIRGVGMSDHGGLFPWKKGTKSTKIKFQRL